MLTKTRSWEIRLFLSHNKCYAYRHNQEYHNLFQEDFHYQKFYSNQSRQLQHGTVDTLADRHLNKGDSQAIFFVAKKNFSTSIPKKFCCLKKPLNHGGQFLFHGDIPHLESFVVQSLPHLLPSSSLFLQFYKTVLLHLPYFLIKKKPTQKKHFLQLHN